MSVTFLQLQQKARRLLQDENPASYQVGRTRLKEMLLRHAQSAGERFGLSEYWLSSAVAVTAGADDFSIAVPGQTITVSRVLDLKRSTDGTMLFRRPRSWIDAQRAVPSVATGPPTDYYLWEAQDGTPKVSLWPQPDSVMTLAALLALIPDAALDADTIPLSGLLVSAVLYRVAAEAVTVLSDEARARLGLGASAAQAWLAEAEKSERREAARRARMTRPSHIPAQVP